MNKHEFQKQNHQQKHLKDDMKKRFDDRTEFAKEFTTNANQSYYDNEHFQHQFDTNEEEKNN